MRAIINRRKIQLLAGNLILKAKRIQTQALDPMCNTSEREKYNGQIEGIIYAVDALIALLDTGNVEV